MSKIRNKISSIEADDNVVSRALGLHPVTENEPLAPVAPSDDIKPAVKKSNKSEQKRPILEPKSEKPPAIASRPPSFIETDQESNRGPLWITLAFAALWLIGTLLALAFFIGFKNISGYTAGQFGGLAFFVLFPLVLIAVLYAALKNLTGLAGQAARLQTAADSLMQVDETVVRRATEMSGVIKREIDTLNSGIDTALSRASTLHEAIETETEKLGETSLAIEDKTQKITDRLSTEREALWSISNSFDEQMKALTQSLDKHSEDLALSTKTAEQKIQEARLSVENTASKINQTSDLIRSNTMEAATTLTGNQEEILKLSNQLKDRAGELDDIYQKHGSDLNAMIAQLRNEQDVLSKSLEERLSKMRDVALSAQVSAERLTEASEAGRQTVMSLSEASKLSESAIKNRFSEMEEMVKYSNAKAENISDQAARRVQDSLSQTRKEISRIESDMADLQEKMSEARAVALRPNPQPAKEMDTPSIQEPNLVVPEKKSKGSLKFRPLDDDETDETRTETASSGSSLIAGLRPTPAEENTIRPVSIETTKVEATTEVGSLDFSIEDGLIRPANVSRDADRTSISRAVDTNNPSKTWWKNLFGKTGETPSPPTSNSSERTPFDSAPTLAVTSTAPTIRKSRETFLRVLNSHGLSPNAIVDNGTIVEAVENRMQNGTKHMSLGVANRLNEPIQYLSNLLENDPSLKSQAIDFAVQFHHSLEQISGDPNGLIEKFGTEDGRLFLMCDAALNS